MDNDERTPVESTAVGVTQLYNSTPEKVQPWMQPTGGIPEAAIMCAASDNTHGVSEGSWLVMENAPKGLRGGN